MSDETLPRRWELAADQALQGLCPDEGVEFDAVLPPGTERDELLLELELLAAEMATLAAEVTSRAAEEESLPAGLAERLRASLPAELASALPPRATAKEPVPEPAAPSTEGASGKVLPMTQRRTLDPVRWGGWAAAAAALLGWVVSSGVGSEPTPSSEADPLARGPESAPLAPLEPPTAEPPRELTPAEKRAQLAEESGTRVVSWQTTTDPAAQSVTGDLVWHAGKQQGFLRFRGLPKNDPHQIQYQLWIFDGERDERHPVDGGVFDAEHEGEIVVPIDARVPVHRAQLFAITVEPPGGVVVSTRERIVVTAALPPT